MKRTRTIARVALAVVLTLSVVAGVTTTATAKPPLDTKKIAIE
jgi:hypothetical protein